MPARKRRQASTHPEQGCLSRTVRARQHDNLAAVDVEIEAGKRGKVTDQRNSILESYCRRLAHVGVKVHVHTLGGSPTSPPLLAISLGRYRVDVPERRDHDTPSSGYSVREVLGRAHRQGPTARWARFYRQHWRRLKAASARRWERPPEPHDWRWAIGLLGRALVTAGLLMLGFVGYQLWGTGLSTASAQADLKAEFVASLQTSSTQLITTTTTEVPSTVVTPSTTEVTTVQTTEPQPVANPEFAPGDVVGQLQIPSIDVDFFVVSGVGVEELRLGPGHFTDTPLPGQLGNSAIAGHRTTYGQPFHNLDQLTAGDEIIITTTYGTFTYEVSGLQVVEPTDYAVVSTTDPTVATLTLTTCHPKWSAAQRLIVTADLNSVRSDPLLPKVLVEGERSEEVTTTTLPAETLSDEFSEESSAVETSSSETSASVAEVSATTPPAEDAASTNSQGQQVFSAGWFHDSTALVQSIIWMVILVGIRMVIIRVSQRRKSWWPMLPVGLLPVAIGLYFFYVNVNNLVPPNL